MSAQPIVMTITSELQLRVAQVEQAVELLDDGNSIPFISRYRKEVTGDLDEEQLRLIESRLAPNRDKIFLFPITCCLAFYRM